MAVYPTSGQTPWGSDLKAYIDDQDATTLAAIPLVGAAIEAPGMSAKKTNPEADALPYEGMPDKVTIPKKPGKVPPPEDLPEETADLPEPYWGP